MPARRPEQELATPVLVSVLYLDRQTRKLDSVDEITLGSVSLMSSAGPRGWRR
jgi:hypothetical protein